MVALRVGTAGILKRHPDHHEEPVRAINEA
jgi:hypothetical protein